MLKFILLGFLFFVSFRCGLSKECSTSDQKLTAEATLREKLFCNYNKKVRPVKYFSNQTVVLIDLYPLKINMDEKEEKITLHGNIHYVWFDRFIQWNPEEYEGIKILSLVDEEIWTPDITIASSSNEMKLQANKGNCLVTSVGKVVCFPLNTINSYCSPNLLRYPFDVQNCSFFFLAQTYAGNHLNLDIYESGFSAQLDSYNMFVSASDRMLRPVLQLSLLFGQVIMSMYRPNKVWDIINITLEQEVARYGVEENSTFYPYLTCNIIIKRHSASHKAIIILPGLVLAGLTLLTFLINDMHSSRIAIAGITFISNLMYCLYLEFRIPTNGNEVPLVVTFFRDSLLISAFAIATAIIVNNLQKINYPSYNWLSSFMNKLGGSPFGKVFFKDSYTGDDDSAEIIQDTKKKPTTWAQTASFIDRMMLFICLFIYAVLFLFFLP